MSTLSILQFLFHTHAHSYLELSSTPLSAIYTPFPTKTSWHPPYITEHVCYQKLSKPALNFQSQRRLIKHCAISSSTVLLITMMVSWRHQCLLLALLAFVVLSEGSRLPKEYYWEQMLPKKLPSPSSSPSKGTNSVSISSTTTTKTDHSLPTSDGKV